MSDAQALTDLESSGFLSPADAADDLVCVHGGLCSAAAGRGRQVPCPLAPGHTQITPACCARPTQFGNGNKTDGSADSTFGLVTDGEPRGAAALPPLHSPSGRCLAAAAMHLALQILPPPARRPRPRAGNYTRLKSAGQAISAYEPEPIASSGAIGLACSFGFVDEDFVVRAF